MLVVNENIYVPLSELTFSYARSGGPGGQNVNKVNSKAILRWTPMLNFTMPYDVKARFISRYQSRLTVEGELILTSQIYRDQKSNVDSCLAKLKEMIEAVAVRPVQRKATRPSFSAKVKRVETKVLHGKKKGLRQRPVDSD